MVSDIKSPFEHKVLELARSIEHTGGAILTLKLLDILSDYFAEEYDAAMEGHTIEEHDETIVPPDDSP